MNTDRISFLESLAKNSALLKVVFLNHSGAPSKLIADLWSLDLLADRKATQEFIHFCEGHAMVKELRISREFRRTEIIVKFLDTTEMRFILLRGMIRKAFSCLHVDEIRATAFVNEFGMNVAAHEHHFDYIFLSCQFAQISFPDRYKNYFSSFDFDTRTKVFRYIQPRYDLVINTLDELYTPKGSTQLKIMVGLRRDPMNSLFKMILRVVEYGFFKFFRLFRKRVTVIHNRQNYFEHEKITSRSRNRAGQAVL